MATSFTKTATVTDRRYNRWLNRFAWLTAVATLFLICSGGMVTSKNAGLAVPDWPTTFGYNMFLFPVSKWIGGIFFEHTHRLAASTVGLLTCVLALWLHGAAARRFMRWSSAVLCGIGVLATLIAPDPGRGGNWIIGVGLVLCAVSFWWPRSEPLPFQTRALGVAAVALVIVQGILGGLRVTMLKDQIGIFHACLAQAFLGLIILIALVTSSSRRALESADNPQNFRWIKILAIVTTLAIYLQLALGATMRHQHRDLAILDFPTANGTWIPDTSAEALAQINTWRDLHALSEVTASQIWLQMAHRLLALIITVGVIAVAVRIRRLRKSSPAPILSGLSIVWVALVLGQITLGAWVIWSNKAADIATAHVALGAIMLSFGVTISAISWGISREQLADRLMISLQTREAAVG